MHTTTSRAPSIVADSHFHPAIQPPLKWTDLIPGRRYRFAMTDGQAVGATFYGWGVRVTEERCSCCGGKSLVRQSLIEWGHFLWDGKASDGQPAHQLFDVDQVMPLASVVDLVERIEELRQ